MKYFSDNNKHCCKQWYDNIGFISTSKCNATHSTSNSVTTTVIRPGCCCSSTTTAATANTTAATEWWYPDSAANCHTKWRNSANSSKTFRFLPQNIYSEVHKFIFSWLLSAAPLIWIWKSSELYIVSSSTYTLVHRCGTGGSMRACHAAGPGSIPGRDKFPGWGFFVVFFLTCKTNVRKL